MRKDTPRSASGRRARRDCRLRAGGWIHDPRICKIALQPTKGEARCSLAGEVRFALLQERSNSFAMVFGLEQFGQAGTDPGAKFLPIRIECAAESILQFSDRKRRIRCDLAR